MNGSASAPAKRKHEDEEDTTATKSIAGKKPRVAKPKVIINHAPTQRLDVYVFGEGSSGELGLGPEKTAKDVKRPRLNPLLPADAVGVVQVAVGGMHCAALTHDNKILTWGVNDQGALGRDTQWEAPTKDIDAEDDGDSSDSDSDGGLNPFESKPTPIDMSAFPEGTVITQLAASDSATFALTDEGEVYGWGTFRVSVLRLYNIICEQMLPLPQTGQGRHPWVHSRRANQRLASSDQGTRTQPGQAACLW